MSIVSIQTLAEIRKRHADKRIGFCSGAFDLTHAGHALFLENGKSRVDVLVVAVGSDAVIRTRKGPQRPIQSEHVRVRAVDALKPVDYCFIDSASTEADLLAIVPVVFAELKPDLYVINDDAFEIPRRQEIADRFGIPMVIQERTCPPELEDISTTNIVERIQRLGQDVR